MHRCFKLICNTKHIAQWKSKGLSDESIKPITTCDNSLVFGAVTLTKNADIDKYGYSGYGIGFNRKSSFSFPSDVFGQNELIFGADMSSSAHIDNKKDILVLGKRTNTRIRTYIKCRKKCILLTLMELERCFI